MQTRPIITELPASLSREIGRVMVYWAALETMLGQALFAALSLGNKCGRISIRAQRAQERIDTISEILGLRGIDFQKEEMKALRKDIEQAATFRDALAHGVWTHSANSKTLRLRRTKGDWQPDKKMKGKISRLIRPEGIIYTAQDARTLWESIRDAYHRTVSLDAYIREQLEASPRKSP